MISREQWSTWVNVIVALRLVFGEMLRLDNDVSGATSFELVATLRFDVATGTSREKRCIVLFLRLDTQLLVALDSSREALSSYTIFGSCRGLERKHEVAVLVRRAAIPHSHLPAGIVATMRRVVNYHSSWVRQQQVELFDASGNLGSTAGRGFNPSGGAPGGG
ncbi:TMV resistance protein N-like [Dorcoceras hygrometricum]|uniref:TMV resistance protein N-like n=1 Tax=Dorcoceras hygrometricum TaxID=472368 RepID=A0A2Z7BRW7_9LAMI|nr:TMV resistance protein N-like [Dorcoceras hygrometricum]